MQPKVKSKASQQEGSGSSSSTRTPACPEGHTRGESNCHLIQPSLPLEPGGSPAAERMTIKPIIQRIKVSPNHTDLIRQITNQQAATSADLPINAQNKAASSPFCLDSDSLRSPESLWPGSPGQRSGHRRVRDGGAAQSSGTATCLCNSTWPRTFTFGTPEASAFARRLYGLPPAPGGDKKPCGSEGRAADWQVFRADSIHPLPSLRAAQARQDPSPRTEACCPLTLWPLSKDWQFNLEG